MKATDTRTGPFTQKEQEKITALEATGCQVWQLTPDSLTALCDHLTAAGFCARPMANHDGSRLIGMTINGVPAHHGEVIIHRPNRRISICTTAAMRKPPEP
jgi:hypothetical protein